MHDGRATPGVYAASQRCCPRAEQVAWPGPPAGPPAIDRQRSRGRKCTLTWTLLCRRTTPYAGTAKKNSEGNLCRQNISAFKHDGLLSCSVIVSDAPENSAVCRCKLNESKVEMLFRELERLSALAAQRHPVQLPRSAHHDMSASE
jgi:hypothetical protein